MNVVRAFCLAIVLFVLATGARAAGVSLPAHERLELANGAVLLLSEKHDVPMIGLEAIVRGGAVSDPEGLGGMAGLLAELLQHGAGKRNSKAFAEASAAVGGELSVSAGLEAIYVSADFMARDAELMIELVADLLQRPTLAADEFTKLRDRSINLIKAAKGSNPGELLPAYGNAFLFGKHPYGNPVAGSETSLANITQEKLQQYYEEQVGSDRLILSVVGNFNAVAMKALLTKAFGGWRPAAIPLPSLTAAAKQTGRRVLLIDKPGVTQTYFWIGNIGVSADYPKRADLDLANTVFGGRFTSMLNTEMRVKAGLTYGAGSILQQHSQPGAVVISSFTATDTTVDAIDMALKILKRLRDSGIDEDATESARNYIMGQFPPRLETAPQLATQFAMLEQYGLDVAYINDYGAALSAATADSIAAAIDEVYPSPEDVSLILIGDADLIRDDVSQYGPVTEMSIDEPRFR
ncbi:MAG: insulinase family protein [Gammaproteobacteria bacterium]|nr:insulinase family protein [Gammaproteobacteria bacterium]MBT8110731.1 insulinase family protein [Gammaproteobacteria bacterium]NNL45430.1 insulinase family protein [Woeseiaceae bacterium]